MLGKKSDGGQKSEREQRADAVICFLSLLIAALLTGMITWRIDQGAEAKLQEHLAGEVLRFHVLANSDSEEDQTLKLKVRDAVLDTMEAALPKGLDVEGTKEWARTHTDGIRAAAERTIRENGYDYPVSAAVTTSYFPDKTYGDVTFPAGNYTALRVEIGEAKGQNWWCVLYPNLCFLDAVNAVVPEEGKQKLEQVLTEEEYRQVTADGKFEIRFKLPELLGSL